MYSSILTFFFHSTLNTLAVSVLTNIAQAHFTLCQIQVFFATSHCALSFLIKSVYLLSSAPEVLLLIPYFQTLFWLRLSVQVKLLPWLLAYALLALPSPTILHFTSFHCFLCITLVLLDGKHLKLQDHVPAEGSPLSSFVKETVGRGSTQGHFHPSSEACLLLSHDVLS